MAALRNMVRSSRTGMSHSSLLVLSRPFSIKLFVGGLTYDTTNEGLSETFSKYGKVTEAKIVKDRKTKKSRGFGMVTFDSYEEGITALKAMDRKELNGRKIRMDYTRNNRNFLAEIPLARGPSKSAFLPRD